MSSHRVRTTLTLILSIHHLPSLSYLTGLLHNWSRCIFLRIQRARLWHFSHDGKPSMASAPHGHTGPRLHP
jgi:hypothetical protein